MSDNEKSNEAEHVPGLRWRSGCWYIDTTCYGKKICQSTGTTDKAEAVRKLKEMRMIEEILAVPKTQKCHFKQRTILVAKGWTVPPLGNDPESRAQREALYASAEWRQRVRGMVEASISGQPLAEAAVANGVSALTAIKWMLTYQKKWIYDLADGWKRQERETG